MKLIVGLVLFAVSIYAATLQEAWKNSGSNEGYDKYVVLESGMVYEGGLDLESLGSASTKIVGNGAVINLQGEKIKGDKYSSDELSIYNAAIINGSIVYEGSGSDAPYGTLENLTIYNSKGYGIRIQSAGENIVVKNSIIAESRLNGGGGNLPDGINIAFSIFQTHGVPEIMNNYSYHTGSPTGNYSVHYSRLCDTG
jgi:parallel beta-helix repeat protein